MEAATVPELAAAPLQGSTKRPARRRRGAVPNDLRERLDRATGDFSTRMAARLIAGQLDGLHPAALTADELADLREAWGDELADGALHLLDHVGYGAAPKRRARIERAHGCRRKARLRGVLGKLPRSLALRLPTSADTHREGPNNGHDRWGEVKCSRTLRADHLGVIAAVCGLWTQRAAEGEDFVDFTASEVAHLLSGEPRPGGKDLARVHQLLADLETLDVSATVQDRKGKEPRRSDLQREHLGGKPAEVSGPSEAHIIPGRPFDAVKRRVGDHLVATADYPAALAAAAEGDGADLLELYAAEDAGGDLGIATIRVHLAPWVREELAHPKRRAVFINFDVWAHLRPSSRRLYAFVQGLGRDDYDDRIYFYLGAPTLFTLGRLGADGKAPKRLDRIANDVSHDLTALWHADERYHGGKGFRRQKHADTSIPAFACDPARRPSRPTAKALATKSPPKRPAGLRGAIARLRRHSILAARGVTPDQLDPAQVRRIGLEAAKREAEMVRQTILNSLSTAAATANAPGPFEPSRAAALQRQRGSDDDDPASA